MKVSDDMTKTGLFEGLAFQRQANTAFQKEFVAHRDPPALVIARYLDFEAEHSPLAGVDIARVAQVAYGLERKPGLKSEYLRAVRGELSKAGRLLKKLFRRHLVKLRTSVRASVNEDDAKAARLASWRKWARGSVRSLVRTSRIIRPQDIRDPMVRENFFERVQAIHDAPILLSLLDADDQAWVQGMVAWRAGFTVLLRKGTAN